MNDLELKLLWQKQALPAHAPVVDASLVENMQKRMKRFDRTLFWRDARELAACGVVAFWFGRSLTSQPSVTTRLGAVVVILSCLFIAWRLISARRSQRSFPARDSVAEFLSVEVAKVSRQIRLLQSVLWWYILPIYVGVALISFGGPAGLMAKAVFMVVLVLSGGFLHWINQYAVRKTLLPLKHELEATLKAVTELPADQQENSTGAGL